MAKAEARKKFLKRKNREERRIFRKNTRQNKVWALLFIDLHSNKLHFL